MNQLPFDSFNFDYETINATLTTSSSIITF